MALQKEIFSLGLQRLGGRNQHTQPWLTLPCTYPGSQLGQSAGGVGAHNQRPRLCSQRRHRSWGVQGGHFPEQILNSTARPHPALNLNGDSECMGRTSGVKGLSFTENFGMECRASFLHRALGKSKHYEHMTLSSGSRAEHCSGVTEQSLTVLFSMHSLQGKDNRFPILIFHLLLLYLSVAFGLISALNTGPAAPSATTLLLALPARGGQSLPAKTKKLLPNTGLSAIASLSASQVFKDYTWKLYRLFQQCRLFQSSPFIAHGKSALTQFSSHGSD